MIVTLADPGPGTTRLDVAGEITGLTCAGLQAAVEPHLRPGTNVSLGMAGVTYVSSAGLRTLLLLHRQAVQLGARVALRDVSDDVRFVMSVTGFLEFLTPTEAEDGTGREGAR
jgi:anti-sigma B factor antagonist